MTSLLPLLTAAIAAIAAIIAAAAATVCASAQSATQEELEAAHRQLLEGGFDFSKLDVSKLPTLPALGMLPPGVQLPPLKVRWDTTTFCSTAQHSMWVVHAIYVCSGEQDSTSASSALAGAPLGRSCPLLGATQKP
jgi:hypothetical protein